MRKYISVFMVAVMLFLTSCGTTTQKSIVTKTNGKVSLPINGNFKFKDDIIIEYEKTGTGSVVKNARAYTYKDGEFYELERFETEITVPKKYTVYGEVYGKDQNLPLQYFVCEGQVYAFLNKDVADNKFSCFKAFSIPQNDECVIIEDFTNIWPIYLNIKTGEMKPVVDLNNQDGPLTASVNCISEDGKYAGVLGTKRDTFTSSSFIVNLENFEITEVCPEIEEGYTATNSPLFFVKERMYFSCSLRPISREGITERLYLYDTQKKRIEESKYELDGAVGVGSNDSIKIRANPETGEVTILDYELGTYCTYFLSPFNSWNAKVNKTGRYIIGECFPNPPEYPEEVYTGGLQGEPEYIVIDMKEQKTFDLRKADSSFDYSTYDGVPCSYEWITEKEIMVICHQDNDSYVKTVINVEDVKQ